MASRQPGLAFPDETQCSICGYFDISHPDVRRILQHREANAQCPPGALFAIAQCRCKNNADKRQRDDDQRYAQARLPHAERPRTFENFQPRNIPDEVRAKVLRFADLQGPKCLVLSGQTGSGKSHLLEAIGRQVLATSGWSVRYETASTLLDRLRDTFAESHQESVYEVVNWYQRRKVLMLDDLGTRSEKDWAIEQLTGLIDERLRMGWWLAVATNLIQSEMVEALGARLASRLFQANEELDEVCRVTITAPDYRAQPAG